MKLRPPTGFKFLRFTYFRRHLELGLVATTLVSPTSPTSKGSAPLRMVDTLLLQKLIDAAVARLAIDVLFVPTEG